MNDDLTPLLRDLPEPAPPATLTATVMARIEREAEQRAEARSVTPVKAARGLSTWLWTFTGIALIVGLFANGWLSLNTPPDFTTSRIGFGRAMLVPLQGPTLWLAGLGLLVYLAGLFAPLRNDRT